MPAKDVCPCGSGFSIPKCCGQYHAGQLEPTAEAVLRARFTAYALGGPMAGAYIVNSTHPRSPDANRAGEPGSAAAQEQLAKDAAATMKNVEFRKLALLASEKGATPDEWWVTFRATWSERKARKEAEPLGRAGKWREAAENVQTLAQRARFLRTAEGAWKYFGGTMLSPTDLGNYEAGAAARGLTQ